MCRFLRSKLRPHRPRRVDRFPKVYPLQSRLRARASSFAKSRAQWFQRKKSFTHCCRLALLPIDERFHSRSAQVQIRFGPRTERTERIKSFCARVLHILFLEIARRDIVQTGVPENVRPNGSRVAQMAAAPSDNGG